MQIVTSIGHVRYRVGSIDFGDDFAMTRYVEFNVWIVQQLEDNAQDPTFGISVW